jgi:hypothetical protein
VSVDNSQSIEALFPSLHSLRQYRAAQADAVNASHQDGNHADEVLLRACGVLREDLHGTPPFVPNDPTQWETTAKTGAQMVALVQGIAGMPCRTPTGLQAKALALYALLDDGDGGGLYPDAAPPDVLAWSLVQDILLGVGCR